MFVCSMLQSSYLLLTLCSDQFTVGLSYNQLDRLSFSLNTSFIQKPEGDFALGTPLGTNLTDRQPFLPQFWVTGSEGQPVAPPAD